MRNDKNLTLFVYGIAGSLDDDIRTPNMGRLNQENSYHDCLMITNYFWKSHKNVIKYQKFRITL